MKYKKLMKVLLTEIFSNQEHNCILDQLVLRHAYKHNYVVSDGVNFTLTKKGHKLLRGTYGTSESVAKSFTNNSN